MLTETFGWTWPPGHSLEDELKYEGQDVKFVLDAPKEKTVRPILLEVVTHVLTTYNHCRHCEVFFDQAGMDKKLHQKEVNEYPSDLKEDFLRLSEWLKELKRLYRHRLLVKLIDVQSFVGMYKSLRYHIRSYPAFIVEGKEVCTGWDKNRLERLLDKHLKASPLLRRGSAQLPAT